MSFTSILVTLFASSIALAQVPLSKNGGPALQMKPEVASKLEASVHVLRLSEEAHCTAAPINKKGDFLTALHCLRPCLIEEGVMETSFNHYIGLFDLAVMTKDSPEIAHCSKLSIEKLGIKGFDVVATGSALSSYSADFVTSFASLFAELKSEGFDLRANDFAIIHARSATIPNCLRLETKTTSTGQMLWSAGYILSRMPPLIPILHASQGKRYGSAEESLYYASRKGKDEQDLVRMLYSDPGILYSNAPPYHGQSGGPVIDESGAIIGVTSGFTTVRDGSKSFRELVAPTVPFIFSHVPAALAMELLQSNQECR